VPVPAPGEQLPQVVEAPRGRHSEKPEAFAKMIERLFPRTPKIELFARKARPGWEAWGNEVTR
jgi:N6-adenosine-specific RNA methylase IME4